MPTLRMEFLDEHRLGTATKKPDEPSSEQRNAGKKCDGDKAPVYQGFEQYFPKAIMAVANISKYGAEKYNVAYAEQNWSRVENASGRFKDSQGRHRLLPNTSEGLYDQESHLLHAAHEAWNAMATLELLLRRGAALRDPSAGLER